MESRSRFWPRALIIAVLALTGAGAWGFTFILNNGTGLPVRWPAGSVPIRIMLGTAQNLNDGSSFNSTAAAAAAIWNAQIGAVQLVPTEAAPGPASSSNSVNELVFAADVFGQKFEENVLAVTTSNYRGNERRPSDIVFNSAITWNSYRGSRQNGSTDLRRVAIHELGHLLGLDHPDEDNQNVSAIMNSRIGNLDTVSADDIQGAQAMYGPPGVPANNNFANATVVDFNGGLLNLTGYNTNATKESGEPNHADNIGGRSVWWRWHPTNPGTVTIDTRGSYCDTLLAVYTGASLTSLTPVASDDDINDGVVQASTVTFQVVGNTTYMIAVDGFNGDSTGADSAGLKLNFSFTPASADSVVITTQPASATVDAGGSTSFSVAVVGASPITYQWYFNNVAISGATNATYAVSNATSGQGGGYYVIVSNSLGSVTSNMAYLTVRAVSTTPSTGGGGGGGGGGGAPSLWFLAAWAALGAARLRRHRAS